MKETRKEATERLSIAGLLVSCLCLPDGVITIISQHAQRSSPGIGAWVKVDGGQAVMLGVVLIVIGILAGWTSYLKRAEAIYPDWTLRIRIVAGTLLLILVVPPLLGFMSGAAGIWKKTILLGSIISGSVLALSFHALMKRRIINESGQQSAPGYRR